MKLHRWILAMQCWLALALLTGSQTAFPATGQTAAIGTHTPAKGSAERSGILDALRGVVRKMSGLEVVFVVKHLKVNHDWAWIEAEPESADGKNHYEPMTGLLQRKNGRWVYVEGPPEFAICEADPDCIDTARYFGKLAKKYPSADPDIFPRP